MDQTLSKGPSEGSKSKAGSGNGSDGVPRDTLQVLSSIQEGLKVSLQLMLLLQHMKEVSSAVYYPRPSIVSWAGDSKDNMSPS